MKEVKFLLFRHAEVSQPSLSMIREDTKTHELCLTAEPEEKKLESSGKQSIMHAESLERH